MAAENVLLQDLIIELLGLLIVAGESLGVMWDGDATIRCALEGAKHARAGRGALEAGVEVRPEGARSIVIFEGLLDRERAIGLLHTLVLVRKTEFGQRATRDEETGCVSWSQPPDVSAESDRSTSCGQWRTSSPVSKTVVDAIAGELVRVCLSKDKVTLEASVDDLGNDVLVREADDETVLRRVAKQSATLAKFEKI
jgi:hypothetical protein